MAATELDNEQRRQLVDVTQVFEAWRQASRDFKRAYSGTMHWRRSSNGQEYLGRKYGSVWKSLGVRSSETERIKDEYTVARQDLRQRTTKLRNRIETMAPLNRALRLGRMPATPARVLRKLDDVGLLDGQLVVVGTHSMFAYECRSGVLFESGLTATADVDLLMDARHRLSLAIAAKLPTRGLIALLQQVDHSFKATTSYRATNSDGYYVDLIAAMRKNEATAAPLKLAMADDLEASSIAGLQWLINVPRLETVVVADDGLPVFVPCIDPRAFALHKFWMSQRPEREAVKRRRDAAQARAVYEVVTHYLGLDFKAKDLSALPLELTNAVKDLVGHAKERKPRGKS